MAGGDVIDIVDLWDGYVEDAVDNADRQVWGGGLLMSLTCMAMKDAHGWFRRRSRDDVGLHLDDKVGDLDVLWDIWPEDSYVERP